MTSKRTVSLGLLKFALCLGFIIVQLDISVVNVALDALRASFDARVADLEWVINAYALVFAAFLLATGAFSERYGALRMFVMGVGIFIAASIGCAMSPSLSVLIGFRCLQGLGAALLVPTSLTLIRVAFDSPANRAKAVGAWSSCGALALAAGPIAGGFLITLMGWQSVFLLNVPIGIAVIWLASRNAPEERTSTNKIDVFGQTLVVFSLGAMTYGLTESARYGWADKLTWGSFALGAALLGVFLFQQTKSKAPILPPSIFKVGEFSVSTLVAAVSNFAFYGTVFVLSLYFQSALKLSPAETGLAFLPMMITASLSTFVAGPLAAKFSLRFIVPLGMTISALGFIGLLFINETWSYSTLVWPTLLLGAGTSIVVPSLATSMLAALPKAQTGIASGAFASSRQLGGVAGVSIFGFVIASSGPAITASAVMHIAAISSTMLFFAGAVGFTVLPHGSKPKDQAMAKGS